MYAINNVTFIPNGEKVTIKLADHQWDAPIEAARNFYRHQQQLIKHPLKDGSEATDYNERCPQHNTPVKKEYHFGRNDSMVCTFKGCQCAVAFTGWPNKPTYHTNYKAASGTASMQKAFNSTF